MSLLLSFWTPRIVGLGSTVVAFWTAAWSFFVTSAWLLLAIWYCVSLDVPERVISSLAFSSHLWVSLCWASSSAGLLAIRRGRGLAELRVGLGGAVTAAQVRFTASSVCVTAFSDAVIDCLMLWSSFFTLVIWSSI